MIYNNLSDFLTRGKASLAKGPVAIIFIEDMTEVESTLRHHRTLGFPTLAVLSPFPLPDLPELAPCLHEIRHDVHQEGAVPQAVNRISEAAPGVWMYYCFNAEYLFFPFCETRSIREFVTFHAEERRDAVLAYVVDLYAGDLERFPNAVDRDGALMDRSGYFALARTDPDNHNHPKERQLDFFGGLRWRFEEHVNPARRKIDRIAIFRAQKGLELREDHTFNIEEYNTYACPWHNNMTAAIASFRAAKALRTNPGSAAAIRDFRWYKSVRFDWHSQQLMDLGLMEPGQWF
ncbi:hypothetical protein ACFQXB_03075 [Plastorhodobacter daqingensis]|uniref:Glycosyl transferase family 2 n=1 Tax=Plastorhodobacter daqingensis TaxID=1387281 RepID=A0ABW2UES3_9RHOB